jgi:hypothetical protein
LIPFLEGRCFRRRNAYGEHVQRQGAAGNFPSWSNPLLSIPCQKDQDMALIKCQECFATIAENAACCPSWGFIYERDRKKHWFELFTTLSGPLILSAAGTVLAYMTFLHQATNSGN